MFCNVGTLIVTSGFYWISAGLYAIMDYTQKPAFFMKYKIQPTKNIPPDTKRVLKVTLKVLIAISPYTFELMFWLSKTYFRLKPTNLKRIK